MLFHKMLSQQVSCIGYPYNTLWLIENLPDDTLLGWRDIGHLDQ
jgi:hypothetical protein